MFPHCHISSPKKDARENRDRVGFMHVSSGASLPLVALLRGDGGTEGSHKPSIETPNFTWRNYILEWICGLGEAGRDQVLQTQIKVGASFHLPLQKPIYLDSIRTAVHAWVLLLRLTGSLRDSAGYRSCHSITRFLRSPARDLISEGLCSILQPAGTTFRVARPPHSLGLYAKGKTGSLKGEWDHQTTKIRPSPTLLWVSLEKQGVIINAPYQSVTNTKLGLSSINDKMPMGTVLFSWAAWEVCFQPQLLHSLLRLWLWHFLFSAALFIHQL